jgi:hypothetical protein
MIDPNWKEREIEIEREGEGEGESPHLLLIPIGIRFPSSKIYLEF